MTCDAAKAIPGILQVRLYGAHGGGSCVVRSQIISEMPQENNKTREYVSALPDNQPKVPFNTTHLLGSAIKHGSQPMSCMGISTGQGRPVQTLLPKPTPISYTYCLPVGTYWQDVRVTISPLQKGHNLPEKRVLSQQQQPLHYFHEARSAAQPRNPGRLSSTTAVAQNAIRLSPQHYCWCYC